MKRAVPLAALAVVGVLLSGLTLWRVVEAIQRRDYPQIQGGIVLIAGIMMAVNLSVDLAYGLLNPRIRHASGR